MNQKIQLIEKQIPNAGATVRVSEELDKDFEHLTGIAVLDNIGLNSILLYSSIDGNELFPKNFEVSFFQSNLFVAPDERFLTLKEKKAKGNRLELDFQDGGTAPNYPYTLKIYLKLSNQEQ